jgi:hypothetical protein
MFQLAQFVRTTSPFAVMLGGILCSVMWAATRPMGRSFWFCFVCLGVVDLAAGPFASWLVAALPLWAAQTFLLTIAALIAAALVLVGEPRPKTVADRSYSHEG